MNPLAELIAEVKRLLSPEATVSAEDLQALLGRCIEAGKTTAKAVDRDGLQSLATILTDNIYLKTKAYPLLTVIAPAEVPEEPAGRPDPTPVLGRSDPHPGHRGAVGRARP